jgi:hypothetical protein
MALEIQGRRRRDKISLGNPADSGLIAGFREILLQNENAWWTREDSNLQPSGYAPVVCNCPAAAESYWNLNKIGVRSFILSGAPPSTHLQTLGMALLARQHGFFE